MLDIKMIRGTTMTLDIGLTDADGAAYTMGANDKLIFGVKSNPQNTAYDLKKVLTSSDAQTGGSYKLSLTPSDTIDLPIGRYYYDVGLQSGSDYYTVIECSAFDLLTNITKKEA